MDLNEWRKQRLGEEFTLPSGLAVRLRRCQLLDLAEQGRIPAPLVGLANKLLASDSLALTVEDYRQYAPMINTIAAACLVEPQGLEIEEMPAADRLAIYNWANDITVAVQPFATNAAEMALLDRISVRYGQRPSDVLGIRDSWAAYQFDLAVMQASAQMANAGGDTRAQMASKTPSQVFGKLKGSRGIRKIRVPESGVW